MALEISSREQLEDWLRDEPIEWAQVIAVRAALRVFPLILRGDQSQNHFGTNAWENVVLRSLRAVFVPWAAFRYTNNNIKPFVRGVGFYSFEMEDECKFACRAISDAAVSISNVPDPLEIASRAVSYASFSADGNGTFGGEKQFWASVQQDYYLLKDRNLLPEKLIRQPLWQAGERETRHYLADFPKWVSEPSFVDPHPNQLRLGGTWGLIVQWYLALFDGETSASADSAFGQSADVVLATQPDEFWELSAERQPLNILNDIAEIIEANANVAETWPDRIVSFLDEAKRLVSLDEIREYFRTYDPPPADTTIRGRLSDLASTGTIIRVVKGWYVHPNWYSGSGDLEDDLKEDISSAVENIQPQTPAAYRFGWRDGQIAALPPTDISSDPEGAQIFLDEVRRKGQELQGRLERSNSDPRVKSSVNGLLDVLTDRVEDLRPQLVRSRARSIEADALAFGNAKDGELELFPDAVAALIDLSETVRDLQGCYPQLRDLEAEIAALDLDPSRLDETKENLDQIVEAVQSDIELSDPSAQEALQTVRDIAAEDAPKSVQQKRIGEYALVVRNFLSQVARAALDNAFTREARRLGSEAYDKARPKIVDGMADGLGSMARPATVITIAGVVSIFAGPTGALVAMAAGFGKVDILYKLAVKWMEKKDASSDEAQEQNDAKPDVAPMSDNDLGDGDGVSV